MRPFMPVAVPLRRARRLLRAVSAAGAAAVILAGLATAPAVQARVVRIEIDERVPLPGDGPAYEQIAGRAFGELDPTLPLNALIQDIELGRDADGKVRYVATFVITRPVDSTATSGLMWHDVPNRGRQPVLAPQERAAGDILVASAWQGDDSGGTRVGDLASVKGNHWLRLPVARGGDGEPVFGEVFGRIVNRAGPGSQPLLVQTNPLPYKPHSLATSQARLVSRGGETQAGEAIDERAIPADAWAWARCDAANPFPGTPDATQICLRDGFDPKRLYQVVFTASDPPILGIGFAAWRDVGHFLRHAATDDAGTPNPIGGHVRRSIGRGISQSGNFLRGWLHLGFNEAETGGPVHDGLWPIIAGRRIALNFRWAQPDGVLELYQAGSEGPQWWLPWRDPVRGLPARGILDRCQESGTCPKIIEHFGSAEVWALKLTPEWVGTDGREDLPLAGNIRRYYIASSTHGGGVGGFDSSLPGAGLPEAGPPCPGNQFGTAVLPANPVPHRETVNAIREHFRHWVMDERPPPPSRYPTLRRGLLGPAHKDGIGFPTLPGLRPTLPEPDFIMPVHDLDHGPGFDPLDGSGIASLAPPRIRQVLPMFAPKVDADGNELGGVPVVLLDAPLGTYLGWNVTAPGEQPFHVGQICNYVGGMIPFARDRAAREANGDPRLSLEERYTDHAGYLAAVRRAARRAAEQGFLLPEDETALIRAAEQSRVLR